MRSTTGRGPDSETSNTKLKDARPSDAKVKEAHFVALGEVPFGPLTVLARKRRKLSEHVTIGPPPRWLKGWRRRFGVGKPEERAVLSGCHVAISSAFSYAGLGLPSILEKTKEEKDAERRTKDVLLALWLVTRGEIRLRRHAIFCSIHGRRFNCGVEESEADVRRGFSLDPKRKKLDERDVSMVRRITRGMETIRGDGELVDALAATFFAMTSARPEVMTVLLWIAIEAMFGSEKHDLVVKRISARVAGFAAGELGLELSEKTVKRLYEGRSKAMHGRSFGAKDQKAAEEKTADARMVEAFACAALAKIVTTKRLLSVMNGPGRDEYLDRRFKVPASTTCGWTTAGGVPCLKALHEKRSEAGGRPKRRRPQS